jgi:GntR family transcriptional regulator/MocR family aminotransferase
LNQKWQNEKSHFENRRLRRELMKKRSSDVLTQFVVERRSLIPLHEQLYRSLRRAIRSGRLPAGARLPSSRTLAGRIGVSRNTVLYAYESLIADGFAEGKVGAGTHVAPVRRRSAKLCDPDGNPIHVS